MAEFVDAWASGVALCEEQVACGVGQPAPCVVAQLPAEQVHAATYHAHLDIQAMARCQESAEVLGACLAGLDCTTLAQAETLCADEHERYAIDCAALLTALDYLDGVGGGSGGANPGSGGSPSGGSAGSGGAFGGSGGATGGSGGSATGGSGAGGSQAVLAVALCDRAEACSGVRWPADQRAVCHGEALPLFGPIIPDPGATEACLDGASCSSFSSDVTVLVDSCVNLDPAASQCLSQSTLRACTAAGVCSDHSCRDVCQASGLIALGCGPGTAEPGDECTCGS